MTADIIRLPSSCGDPPKYPLVLIANTILRLLHQIAGGLDHQQYGYRKNALGHTREAIAILERAVRDHCNEQAYSIGQQFMLAMSKGDAVNVLHVDGARRALQMLADALSEAVPPR